ncbi:MAG TPA: GNAT family N-acetyltransferase [Cellulomonas sp.]
MDAPQDSLVARTLTDPAHLQAAAELYRAVFGYQDPAHGVNPRLLAALAANGGSVVGVLTPDDRVVGFAYGFAGADSHGQTYHYSQAAVVDASVQGQGIGRRLKREQAAIALAHGASTMRWSYDPAVARNAHFNLDVLGGRARWFHPDFYGPGTDRLVVEWDLTGQQGRRAGVDHSDPPAPHVDAGPETWGLPLDAGDGARWLPLPARIAALDVRNPALATSVRRQLHDTLPGLLADGLVAASCRRVDEATSVYRFDPAGRADATGLAEDPA